jgi:hypothetical protein
VWNYEDTAGTARNILNWDLTRGQRSLTRATRFYLPATVLDCQFVIGGVSWSEIRVNHLVCA